MGLYSLERGLQREDLYLLHPITCLAAIALFAWGAINLRLTLARPAVSPVLRGRPRMAGNRRLGCGSAGSRCTAGGSL